jgi:membrane-associated phospholipid phosphatase
MGRIKGRKREDPMKKRSERNNTALFVVLFFVVLYMVLFATNRFVFMPKILLLLLIILLAVYLGKLHEFYQHWFVFLAFIYLSDSLRGTIYLTTIKFQLPVRTLYVINWEKTLFGDIPSVQLQQALLNPEKYTWFEKLLTTIHGTHYLAFLLVGLIIWTHNKQDFTKFKLAFYVATGVGVAFYFIIPTVPPWMASEVFNVIPELVHFNDEIYNMTIPDLTKGFNTNPIAAMPSLHTAFPVLCCLLLWKSFKWKAFPFYAYTAAMLFTIVYTGDHYIVDILMGVLLAFLSYLLISWIKQRKAEHGSPVSSSDASFFFRYRALLIGVFLIALGTGLGLNSKRQFNEFGHQHYTYAPNFIDFTRNQHAFQNNLKVQIYLGNHYFMKKEYDRSLTHLRQALEAQPEFVERKLLLRKIENVEDLIRKRDNTPPLGGRT